MASKEDVNRVDSPKTRAPVSWRALRKTSGAISTPASWTRKPSQRSREIAIFLPISWISPSTVPKTISAVG